MIPGSIVRLLCTVLATWITTISVGLASPLTDQAIREARRIGIIQGNFDPLTREQLEAIQAARDEAKLDLVLIIPNPNPSDRKTLPAEERLALVHEVAADDPRTVYPSEGAFRDLYDHAKGAQGVLSKVQELNPKAALRFLTEDEQSSVNARALLSSHPELYLDEKAPLPAKLTETLPRPVLERILDRGLYLDSLNSNNQRTFSHKLGDFYKRVVNHLGIFEKIRAKAVRSHAEPQRQTLEIEGKTFAVKQFLGSGMTTNVYLVEIDGREYAVKIANSRPQAKNAMKRATRLQQWMSARSAMGIPQVHAFDPDGNWMVSEFIHGVDLGDWLKPSPDPHDPIWRSLETLFSEAKRLQRETGIQLDLRAENIIIRDGRAYLIDLGPIPGSVKLMPEDFPRAIQLWRKQSAPKPGPFSSCQAWFHHLVNPATTSAR